MYTYRTFFQRHCEGGRLFYQGYSDLTDVAPLSSLTVQSHDSHYQSSGQPRSKTLLCSPQSVFFFLYLLFMSSCFGYLLSKTKFYSILFCFFLDIFLILIFYRRKNVFHFVLLWFYTSVSPSKFLTKWMTSIIRNLLFH